MKEFTRNRKDSGLAFFLHGKRGLGSSRGRRMSDHTSLFVMHRRTLAILFGFLSMYAFAPTALAKDQGGVESLSNRHELMATVYRYIVDDIYHHVGEEQKPYMLLTGNNIAFPAPQPVVDQLIREGYPVLAPGSIKEFYQILNERLLEASNDMPYLFEVWTVSIGSIQQLGHPRIMLVEAGTSLGWLAGHTSYYLVVKIKGSWRILHEHLISIS